MKLRRSMRLLVEDVTPEPAEDTPVIEQTASATVEEPEPRVPPSAASTDEEAGSRQSQVVVAERTVQIPSTEEVHEKPRVRTPAALQSLQDELFELRAQLEGLQLELPDVNQGNGAEHG